MFSIQPSFAIPFLNFVHRFSPEQRQRAKNFRGKFQAYSHPQTFCRRYYIHSETSVELSPSFKSYYAALKINQLSLKR